MKSIQYLSTGLLVLISLLILFCEKKNPTNNEGILSIEDLLVKNNEITGWTYAGQGWVANNIPELTTYINGEADIYQRHSFVEAARQGYQGKIDNANRQMILTIYNQGNENNVRALFEDEDLGMTAAINWNGAGKSAHYVRYGLSQVLAFYRGAYFVLLEINYDTDESLNILQQFALNVDGKMK